MCLDGCSFPIKEPSALQVNGREVGRDPRVLQEELQAARGIVVLKILPSYHEAIPPRQVPERFLKKLSAVPAAAGADGRTCLCLQVFFKCHYNYDPENDNLIPCKEAGLRFQAGDILQIVNQDDVNWWQVRVSTLQCLIDGWCY